MSTKMLLNSIYNPPRALRDSKTNNKTIEAHYMRVDSQDDVQTYAVAYPFARQALLEGLKLLKLPAGARVLIPEFICRDVLAVFNKLGLIVHYYGVSENLVLNQTVESLPKCEAIMVLHYFGLATDLKLYQDYCAKHNACLIIDNAHGFLSEHNGVKLGTEGDIGIISVRKTLPIKNGALLISKKPITLPHLQSQKIDSLGQLLSQLFAEIKNSLRPFVALFGVRLLLMLTECKRSFRKLVKGSALPPSLDSDEFVMPDSNVIAPYNEYFSTMDVQAEITRRRDLYVWVNELCAKLPIRTIRQNLHDGECPYGYPFYCKDGDIEFVRKFLLRKGLEIISWPALPKAVQEVINSGEKSHYQELYLVKFLW